MKEIPLTKGYVALVDDEDYEWLMQWKWHVSISRSSPRAARNIGRGRQLFMHRAIMDAPPDKQVDHKDLCGLNNQRSNLRLCSNAENNRNKGKRPNNTVGYCGVVRSGKGFMPKIKINGKQLYFGTFPTPELAAKARDIAAIKYYGEFAHLNFPEENYALHSHV